MAAWNLNTSPLVLAVATGVTEGAIQEVASEAAVEAAREVALGVAAVVISGVAQEGLVVQDPEVTEVPAEVDLGDQVLEVLEAQAAAAVARRYR